MAPPSTIVLESVSNPDSLEICTPYLMPFHIDYSGQAPISTYMPVIAAKENVGTPDEMDNESNGASLSLNSTLPKAPEEPETTDVEMNMDGGTSLSSNSSPTLPGHVTGGPTRLISSFRGRTIQGLNIPLPDGYTGVVLRADDTEDGNMREARNGAKARAQERHKEQNQRKNNKDPDPGSRFIRTRTRSSTKQKTQEPMLVGDDSDDALQYDDDESTMSEDQIRKLSISSKFSSFVLWHADHPVNEGKDEYTRSLTEWTQLAHLIHQSEA